MNLMEEAVQSQLQKADVGTSLKRRDRNYDLTNFQSRDHTRVALRMVVPIVAFCPGVLSAPDGSGTNPMAIALKTKAEKVPGKNSRTCR